MSNLERKLAKREFVVTAEMPVIDGGGLAEIARQLEPMRHFLDACNATDNPSAHAHGDEPEARRVFDLDGPQLIALARGLHGGRYLSGRQLEPKPHFFVGAVENPGAPPFEYRVRRAAKKALAGARFLQLQICYRPELLQRFMGAAQATGLSDRIALIPSVCILRTVAGMRFVASRVPGIDVPSETVARVEQDAGIAKLCTRLGIPPRLERETHGYSAALAV